MYLKKIGATLAASFIATMGVAVTPALAQTTGNIDTTTDASIVIHKYESPTTGNANNGTEQEITGRDALNGVKFEAFPVLYNGNPIDLTTAEGWEAAKGLEGKCNTDLATPYSLGTSLGEKTTADGGKATFDVQKNRTVYLVKETDASGATYATGGAAAKVTKTADSFCVTVPFASETVAGDTTNSQWLYTIHTYPKNTTNKDSKAPGNIGDWKANGLVEWNFDLTIPPLPADKNAYTKFGFVDNLPDYLTYDSIKDVKIDGGEALADTEYSVAVAPGSTKQGLNAAGQSLLFSLTNPGTALKDKAGKKVTLTLVTKLTENFTGYAVENNFYPMNDVDDPTAGGTNTTPDTPPIEGSTKIGYGDVHFTKTDNASTPAALQGAEFAIFNVEDNGECKAATSDYNTDNAVRTAAKDPALISGQDGKVTAANLFVVEAAEIPTDASKDYCLVETKAPSGFAQLAEPVKFTVNVNADTALSDIKNSRVSADSIPGLPTTGLRGVLILTVGGLLVLLVAGLGVANTIRRNKA